MITQDVLITIYRRHGHAYAWAWFNLDALSDAVGRMANNPGVPFDWRDARLVMESARQNFNDRSFLR